MLHAGHKKIFHDSRLHCWGLTSLDYHRGSTLRDASSSELENHRRLLGGSVLSAKAFCFICYLLFLNLLVKYFFHFSPFHFVTSASGPCKMAWVSGFPLLFILLMFFLQRYNKQLNNGNKTIPNSSVTELGRRVSICSPFLG